MPNRLAWRLGLIAIVGAICAFGVAVGFAALIRARLGSSTDATFRKAEADVRRQLAESAALLSDIAGQAALGRDLVRAASTDVAAAQALFDSLERGLPSSSRATTGVTLYDSGRTPLAWAGRVFEFPVSHADDPAGVFVQVDPFGPRLVRVEALPDRERSAGVRPVIVVAEQLINDARIVPGQPETFVLQTSVAPVTVRPRDQPVGEPSPASYAFVVRNAAGQPLLSATVSQNDVEGTRREWNQLRREGVGGTLALALLVAAAAVLLVFLRRPSPPSPPATGPLPAPMQAIEWRDPLAFLLVPPGVAVLRDVPVFETKGVEP